MELLLSAATLSGDGGAGNEKLSQNFRGWAGRSEWSSISSRFLCRFEVNLRGVIIRDFESLTHLSVTQSH
jgi:hypothetical protein